MSEHNGQYDRFPTTHWSLVIRAGMDPTDAKREALSQLLQRYVPALRAFLVYRKRLPANDADDMVQQFVADKILQRDLLSHADQQRGKFRTFLLTSLSRWLVNRFRDEQAEKRAPADGKLVAMGDRAADIAGSDAVDLFDVQWAREVLAHSLDRMRDECERLGRDDVWGVFQCRLVRPLLDGGPPADYEEIVKQFRLKSPAQASNLLMTAKRMFVRALHATVGEYAQGSEETELEIAELQRCLASSGNR